MYVLIVLVFLLFFIPSFAFAQPSVPSNSSINPVSIVISIISSSLISGLLVAIVKGRSDRELEKLKAMHRQQLEYFEQIGRLQYDYDIDLRARRIEAYKKLWEEMYMLRFHGELHSITYFQIGGLVRRLAEWYYEEGGGIFLTEINQKMYYNFVEGLSDMVDRAGCKYNEVSPEELKRIKKIASAFRTSLCQSIGTREEARYPSLYSELQIKLGESDEQIKLGEYDDEKFAHGNDVIIKAYFVGMGYSEAAMIDDVWLHIRALNTNKTVIRRKLESPRYSADLNNPWIYVWDQKDHDKKPADVGPYSVTITAEELSTTRKFLIVPSVSH